MSLDDWVRDIYVIGRLLISLDNWIQNNGSTYCSETEVVPTTMYCTVVCRNLTSSQALQSARGVCVTPASLDSLFCSETVVVRTTTTNEHYCRHQQETETSECRATVLW